MREFGFDGAGTWTWEKDWIHNGGALVGTVDRQGQVLHAHLDHLGSPRVFSNANGISVRQRHFHPFGEVVAESGTAELTMGFTGHERDENTAGTVDDLDYMHQRYYSPQIGRFLSFDPALDSADPMRPGTWNRYAYAVNNPVLFVDPDGRRPKSRAPVTDRVQWRKYLAEIYAKDDFHDGKHYHVMERRGRKLLGRVSVATGEVVDGGKVPNRMIKHLRKLGKIGPKLGGKALGVLGFLIFADEVNADELTAEEWEELWLLQQEQEEDSAGDEWEDLFDDDEDEEDDMLDMFPSF